jgi:hypothetical protein
MEWAWGGPGSARVRRRSDDSGADKVRVEEASDVGSAGDAGPKVAAGAAIVVVMGRGRSVWAKGWKQIGQDWVMSDACEKI